MTADQKKLLIMLRIR